eukprot:1056504-Prymnesium_polylepis.1
MSPTALTAFAIGPEMNSAHPPHSASVQASTVTLGGDEKDSAVATRASIFGRAEVPLCLYPVSRALRSTGG